jgi:hypothetical protein
LNSRATVQDAARETKTNWRGRSPQRNTYRGAR